MSHQSIIEFKQLIQSEIGDFFAGFEQVGEPATPEEMQTKLHANIDSCFAELSETNQEGFSHEAAQALSNLGVSSLDGIRHYVDHRSRELKRYLQGSVEAHLEFVDFSNYEAWRKEALNLDKLSMVLSREVERAAGL